MTKRYTLDEVADLNTDLLERLRGHFGDDVAVDMDDTGGGCRVIHIELLDGWYCWIAPSGRDDTSGYFPCERPHGYAAQLFHKDDPGEAGIMLYDSADPSVDAMLERIGPVLARFAPAVRHDGPDIILANSVCPQCGKDADAIKELADVTTSLVPTSSGFTYDLDTRDYGDIWLVEDAAKAVTVLCANGHRWQTGAQHWVEGKGWTPKP